jgi:hypothetical protein
MSANGLFVNGSEFHLSYMALIERILSEGGKKHQEDKEFHIFKIAYLK